VVFLKKSYMELKTEQREALDNAAKAVFEEKTIVHLSYTA